MPSYDFDIPMWVTCQSKMEQSSWTYIAKSEPEQGGQKVRNLVYCPMHWAEGYISSLCASSSIYRQSLFSYAANISHSMPTTLTTALFTGLHRNGAYT